MKAATAQHTEKFFPSRVSQGIIGFSGALANIDTDGFRSFNDGHRNFAANARIDADLLPQGSLRGFLRYGDAKIGLFNNKNYLGLPDSERTAT